MYLISYLRNHNYPTQKLLLKFKLSSFFPTEVYFLFLVIFRINNDFSFNIINWLISVTKRQSIFYEARNKFLSTCLMNLRLLCV